MDRKKIAFIGDSLTEFFDWQGRFPMHDVMNLGIAGEPVEGLLGRMGRIRSEISDPDIIFVMTGINNLAMGDAEILSRYEKVLNALISGFTGSVVVLQSVLPAILPWLDNAEIERVNHGLERMAGALKIRYLDVYSRFIDNKGNPVPEYLSEDGVHLSDRGYKVWSRAVEEEIGVLV
jgi:lysophospholipase L1-like esterase